ncbi:cystathionine beta-synthase, partial [Cryomyces antarcticus]
FVDDDWLAANDLLPPSPPITAPSSPALKANGSSKDRFQRATIRDLRLKPVTTVLANSPCADAIETMRDKGFDQLPVSSPSSNKLVGLVTLGNLLSYLSSGRATATSPVSDVMFDFTKLGEVVTDPKAISLNTPTEKKQHATTGEGESHPKRKEFVDITRDTPLSALSRFFEWN